MLVSPSEAFDQLGAQLSRHEQEMLLLLPNDVWQAIDRMGYRRLLKGCDVDVAKAIVALARA